MKECRNVLGGG